VTTKSKNFQNGNDTSIYEKYNKYYINHYTQINTLLFCKEGSAWKFLFPVSWGKWNTDGYFTPGKSYVCCCSLYFADIISETGLRFILSLNSVCKGKKLYLHEVPDINLVVCSHTYWYFEIKTNYKLDNMRRQSIERTEVNIIDLNKEKDPFISSELVSWISVGKLRKGKDAMYPLCKIPRLLRLIPSQPVFALSP
jgi:hypothetical protein